MAVCVRVFFLCLGPFQMRSLCSPAKEANGKDRVVLCIGRIYIKRKSLMNVQILINKTFCKRISLNTRISYAA